MNTFATRSCGKTCESVGRAFSPVALQAKSSISGWHFSATISHTCNYLYGIHVSSRGCKTFVSDGCIHLDLHIQELRYLVDRAGISGATRAEFLDIRQVKRGFQRVKVADFQGPPTGVCQAGSRDRPLENQSRTGELSALRRTYCPSSPTFRTARNAS